MNIKNKFMKVSILISVFVAALSCSNSSSVFKTSATSDTISNESLKKMARLLKNRSLMGEDEKKSSGINKNSINDQKKEEIKDDKSKLKKQDEKKSGDINKNSINDKKEEIKDDKSKLKKRNQRLSRFDNKNNNIYEEKNGKISTKNVDGADAIKDLKSKLEIALTKMQNGKCDELTLSNVVTNVALFNNDLEKLLQNRVNVLEYKDMLELNVSTEEVFKALLNYANRVKGGAKYVEKINCNHDIARKLFKNYERLFENKSVEVKAENKNKNVNNSESDELKNKNKNVKKAPVETSLEGKNNRIEDKNVKKDVIKIVDNDKKEKDDINKNVINYTSDLEKGYSDFNNYEAEENLMREIASNLGGVAQEEKTSATDQLQKLADAILEAVAGIACHKEIKDLIVGESGLKSELRQNFSLLKSKFASDESRPIEYYFSQLNHNLDAFVKLFTVITQGPEYQDPQKFIDLSESMGRLVYEAMQLLEGALVMKKDDRQSFLILYDVNLFGGNIGKNYTKIKQILLKGMDLVNRDLVDMCQFRYSDDDLKSGSKNCDLLPSPEYSKSEFLKQINLAQDQLLQATAYLNIALNQFKFAGSNVNEILFDNSDSKRFSFINLLKKVNDPEISDSERMDFLEAFNAVILNYLNFFEKKVSKYKALFTDDLLVCESIIVNTVNALFFQPNSQGKTFFNFVGTQGFDFVYFKELIVRMFTLLSLIDTSYGFLSREVNMPDIIEIFNTPDFTNNFGCKYMPKNIVGLKSFLEFIFKRVGFIFERNGKRQLQCRTFNIVDTMLGLAHSIRTMFVLYKQAVNVFRDLKLQRTQFPDAVDTVVSELVKDKMETPKSILDVIDQYISTFEYMYLPLVTEGSDNVEKYNKGVRQANDWLDRQGMPFRFSEYRNGKFVKETNEKREILDEKFDDILRMSKTNDDLEFVKKADKELPGFLEKLKEDSAYRELKRYELNNFIMNLNHSTYMATYSVVSDQFKRKKNIEMDEKLTFFANFVKKINDKMKEVDANLMRGEAPLPRLSNFYKSVNDYAKYLMMSNYIKDLERKTRLPESGKVNFDNFVGLLKSTRSLLSKEVNYCENNRVVEPSCLVTNISNMSNIVSITINNINKLFEKLSITEKRSLVNENGTYRETINSINNSISYFNKKRKPDRKISFLFNVDADYLSKAISNDVVDRKKFDAFEVIDKEMLGKIEDSCGKISSIAYALKNKPNDKRLRKLANDVLLKLRTRVSLINDQIEKFRKNSHNNGVAIEDKEKLGEYNAKAAEYNPKIEQLNLKLQEMVEFCKNNSISAAMDLKIDEIEDESVRRQRQSQEALNMGCDVKLPSNWDEDNCVGNLEIILKNAKMLNLVFEVIGSNDLKYNNLKGQIIEDLKLVDVTKDPKLEDLKHRFTNRFNSMVKLDDLMLERLKKLKEMIDYFETLGLFLPNKANILSAIEEILSVELVIEKAKSHLKELEEYMRVNGRNLGAMMRVDKSLSEECNRVIDEINIEFEKLNIFSRSGMRGCQPVNLGIIPHFDAGSSLNKFTQLKSIELGKFLYKKVRDLKDELKDELTEEELKNEGLYNLNFDKVVEKICNVKNKNDGSVSSGFVKALKVFAKYFEFLNSIFSFGDLEYVGKLDDQLLKTFKSVMAHIKESVKKVDKVIKNYAATMSESRVPRIVYEKVSVDVDKVIDRINDVFLDLNKICGKLNCNDRVEYLVKFSEGNEKFHEDILSQLRQLPIYTTQTQYVPLKDLEDLENLENLKGGKKLKLFDSNPFVVSNDNDNEQSLPSVDFSAIFNQNDKKETTVLSSVFENVNSALSIFKNAYETYGAESFVKELFSKVITDIKEIIEKFRNQNFTNIYNFEALDSRKKSKEQVLAINKVIAELNKLIENFGFGKEYVLSNIG